MQILDYIYTNHHTRAPQYSKLFDEIFNKLFRTVKHEDITVFLDSDPLLARRLFVKTHAYNEVKSQSAYILSGRKGTGKTTLTEYMARWHKGIYKEHLPVKLDNFELETISALLSEPQAASDTKYVVRRERVFRIAWEVFLYVHCMEILVQEHVQKGLAPEQEKALPHIIHFLENAFKHDIQHAPLKQSAVYHWALTQVLDAIKKVIQNGRINGHAEFYHDVDRGVATTLLLEKVLGQDVLYPLRNILQCCRRRFLISLDGFDRNFDEFRRIAKRDALPDEEVRRAVSLEKDWVRSLLYLCRLVKGQKDKWGLYSLVDFCVTIPKDRCIEIVRDERDAVAYLGRIREIKWSGVELAIMLRKRLEVLFDYFTDKESSAVERLKDVLAVGMPELPENLVLRARGNDYRQHIFIDVLRHTFWRPRDVLMYFTAIIATYIYLTKHGIAVDTIVVKKKISDTTFDVIDREFISEFQSSLLNIEEIIGGFRRCKQILSYNELEHILGNLSFHFIDSVKQPESINSKAAFLFEIGFLGLRCPYEVKDRFKLMFDDVFYFNDGGKLDRMIADETWKECPIVIHPVFFEYLDLKNSEHFITLQYTWEYLQQQEALDFAILH